MNPTIAHPGLVVTGGIDTHRDTHTAAALDHNGQILATATFGATQTGYRDLTNWLTSFGELTQVGIEGTGSYGTGINQYLTNLGVTVIEVTRPNRQHRRRYGKTDTTDAIGAARSVLSGEATGTPRGNTGPVEAIRQLKIAYNSAIGNRTRVINQIRALVVTAPHPIKETFTGTSITNIIAIVTRYRPTNPLDPTHATKYALKSLATQWRTLTTEITQLHHLIDTVTTHTAPPALLDEPGLGPINTADLVIAAGSNPDRLHTEAAFAALCGVSPIDASSGRQQRHRLNRGGDRQANAAIHRAVIVRLRYHQPTKNYMTRRLTEGKTKPEIIRCLKRILARRIYRHLTNPQTPH